jgi:hypothetical protein
MTLLIASPGRGSGPSDPSLVSVIGSPARLSVVENPQALKLAHRFTDGGFCLDSPSVLGCAQGVRLRGRACACSPTVRLAPRPTGREQNIVCLAAGSPLQSVPPTPCKRRWRNKPSEVSFDSRRGATLETFSSRSEHSGPGAGDEPPGAPDQAKRAEGKPLCGLPLSPTIVAAVAVVPGNGE